MAEAPTAFVTSAVAADGECVIEADSAPLLRGAFDLSEYCDQAHGAPPGGMIRGYHTAFRVENQVLYRGSPQGTPSPARSDPNVLRITGAQIELQSQGGQVIAFPPLSNGVPRPNPFSVAASATVPSAEADKPGSAIVAVEAIPGPYVDALRAGVGPGAGGVLVVALKLFGKTLGGVDIDVATYFHNVELCRECRVVCSEALGDERIKMNVESACNANPGSDKAFCIVDQTTRPACARF